MSTHTQKYACSAMLSRIWLKVTNKKPPFEKCCIDHDMQYRDSTMHITRKEADTQLLQCMHDHHSNARIFNKVIYSLIRSFGWLFFKKRKESSNENK